MLRGLILWLLAVLVLLAISVFQKGNVGWLFWILIVWFVVGAAWQVIRERWPRSVGSDTHGRSAGLERDGQFDPDLCGRIVRAAAICFASVVILELVVLLALKSTKCPGWQVPTDKGTVSLWVPWGVATFWTLNICYHAVTWQRFSRRILDQLDWARQTYVPGTNPTWLTNPTQFKAMCTVKNNINMLIIAVQVMSVLPVALPILTATRCI